jgi:hypothetical protein
MILYIKKIFKGSKDGLQEDVIVYLTKRQARQFEAFFDDTRMSFDEDLKIKKQVDWIEYDPSVLTCVVKRYEEQGIDKTPEWLDLSRDSNTD